MQLFPHFRIFKNKSTTFSVQERKSWIVLGLGFFFYSKSYFLNLFPYYKIIKWNYCLKEEEVEMGVEDHIQ